MMMVFRGLPVLLWLLKFSAIAATDSNTDDATMMDITNPYYSGCLREKLNSTTQLRVCNGDDPPSSLMDGHCRAPDFPDSYMEIRINAGDWDSPIIATWLVQIILTEILGVPTSVEAGSHGESRNFYDPQSKIDYWTTSHIQNLGNAAKYEHGDCRLAPKGKDNYEGCAHFMPEHWHIEHEDVRLQLNAKTIDPPQNIGSLGHETWFVTKFSVEADPILANYIGLQIAPSMVGLQQGEERRQKLAETFKQPTTWQDYCEIVSSSNCTVPDEVAERPPDDDDESSAEGGRYFAPGLFTGHFRTTDQNNCTLNPSTCSGHIADYNCGWVSYMGTQLHHLNIPLTKQRYSYGQATELWHAANATKSNIMMMWWTPEPLYQQYLGSDAEMIQVVLPPQTQECVKARPPEECTETSGEIIGPPEAACSQAPRPLAKMISSTLQDARNTHIPEAIRSPAYAMLQNFQLREVQLNELFGLWMKENSPREAVCKWAAENQDFLMLNVPPTYPRVTQVEDESVFSYITIAIAAFSTVLVTLTAIVVYRNQTRSSIRYAQVEFLWLLLAGALLISIGAILASLPASDATCIAAVWFINIGYTLELVPLIVKVAAINSMMASGRRMRRVTLERKHLHGAVAIISLFIIFFLILWTIFDAPHKEVDYSLTESTTEGGDKVVAMSHYCEDGGSDGWKFAAVAWNAGLLLCASVLAFQTRNIIKTFNESQTLAILIYSHFVFVILRFTTYFLGDNVDGATLNYVRSLLFSLDTMVTIVIYFVPKFLADDNAYGASSRTSVSGFQRSGIGDSTHMGGALGTSSQNFGLQNSSEPKSQSMANNSEPLSVSNDEKTAEEAIDEKESPTDEIGSSLGKSVNFSLDDR